MRIPVKSLFLGVLLLCLCGVASAATLIVNCTTASGSTELSTTISCAQFNIAGATLQSIQITVSGSISGSITLTNNASTTQTGSGTTLSNFSFGSLAGFTYVNPVFMASFTTGTQPLNAGQTVTFSGLLGTGNGSLGTNSSNFAPYTGAGNFTIPVSTATGYTSLISGGNFGTAQATSASATAVVTFTFVIPTSTPTVTPTSTPTNTPTITPTNTPTNTPTITPTNTPTNTPTVPVVPTVNESGMLIFGVLIAAAGLLLLVRRR